MAFCLVGIGLWVGATVVAAVLNDDPGEPAPVLLTFAAGGALFFGAIFGIGLWRTRPRSDPELDLLLAELTIEPGGQGGSARAIGGMRRIARAYMVLGAIVTGLGLVAIVEAALEIGSPVATVWALVAITVAWALAIPFVLRYANSASAATLGPLGLAQRGAALVGERHGRQVRVEITPKGSATSLDSKRELEPLAGPALAAAAGRGEPAVWAAAEARGDGERITVRREGHEGASWLWDLWVAEKLAD